MTASVAETIEWPPGLLELPIGASAKRPCPAAIVLAPFGAWDRFGTIPGEVSNNGDLCLFDPFAEALLAAGVAVVRFDTRFVSAAGAPDSARSAITFDGLVADGLELLAQLRADDRIDGDRISLLGISIGAQVATRIAAIDGEACRLILVAPLATTRADQHRFIGVTRRVEWLYRARLVADGRVDMPAVVAAEAARSGWWDDLGKLADEKNPLVEEVAAQLALAAEEELAQQLSVGDADATAEFWRGWIAAPAAADTVRGLHGRMAIHVGDDDLTTPVRQALLLHRSAGPDLTSTVRVHPGLSHLMSRRDPAGRLTYGPIDPEVAAAVAADAAG